MSTPEPPALPPELLAHPALWRGSGRGVAQAFDAATLPTGFAALDACLPGGGWPRRGLVELLADRHGIGELSLLLPALATLCRANGRAHSRANDTPQGEGGWIAWIAPPHAPYAPALAARGIDLQRVLVVHAPSPEWAIEQALSSGACSAVLGWTAAARAPAGRGLERGLRRLQLAAERSGTLAVLFRPLAAAACASPAVLRLALAPLAGEQGEPGLEVHLLKSRGGRPGRACLRLPVPDADVDAGTS